MGVRDLRSGSVKEGRLSSLGGREECGVKRGRSKGKSMDQGRKEEWNYRSRRKKMQLSERNKWSEESLKE